MIAFLLILGGLVLLALDDLVESRKGRQFLCAIESLVASRRTASRNPQLNLAELRRASGVLTPTFTSNVTGAGVYVGNWLIIVGLVLLAYFHQGIDTFFFCSILIAGRFRSLQELSHFASHRALTQAAKLGYLLADFLCQIPLLLPRIKSWQRMHCIEHHPNVGDSPNDTAFAALTACGLRSSMTKGEFARVALTPLRPSGLRFRVHEILTLLHWGSNARTEILFRIFALTLLLGLPLILASSVIPTAILAVSLMLWLPLFSWLSLLCEHRWFILHDEQQRAHREITMGKRTDFPGVAGAVARSTVFPVGDTYHLAHSLFPAVRHNHLRVLDEVLNRHFPPYSRAIQTSGFIIGNAYLPSTMGELISRIVIFKRKSDEV